MFLKHTTHLFAFESTVHNLRMSHRNFWSSNSLSSWKFFCFLLILLPYKTRIGNCYDLSETVFSALSRPRLGWELSLVVWSGYAWWSWEWGETKPWHRRQTTCASTRAKRKIKNHHPLHANLMKRAEAEIFIFRILRDNSVDEDHELFPALNPKGAELFPVKVLLLKPMNLPVAYKPIQWRTDEKARSS